MFTMHILLICGLLALAATKVDVSQTSEGNIYSYDDMKAKISDRTISGDFDDKEAREAYTCIRNAVMNSAFYDDFKVGSEELDFNAMDQIEYLDKEVGYEPDTGNFTKQYNTPSEFADTVTKAFLGFKDSHQTITFSSVQNGYYYTLAFVPQPELSDNTTVFKFHKVLDGKYKGTASLYFSYYNNYMSSTSIKDDYEWTCNGTGNGPEGLDGGIILRIAGILPNNTLDEELAPLDFFRQYAESESNFSKDIGANIINSIYNFKSGNVNSTGMPKYKGFRYVIQKDDENTYSCDIPYVFTTDIYSSAEEVEVVPDTPGDDFPFTYVKVLVDEDTNEGWIHLSIWYNNSDGCYYALLILESMIIDMKILRNIRTELLANKNDIKKLIVDVRGNGGGNPAESGYLTSLFNWDAPEPHSRYLRMRATEYNKDLNFTDVGFDEEAFDKASVFDVYDHRTSWLIKDLFNETNIERLNFTNNADQNKPVYQSNYTRIFTQRDDDIYSGETYNYLISGDFYGEALDLDPVDVVIITDGRCGSACATFYWNAFKSKSARIVNFGELISGSGEPIVPSAASFAGGQKIDKLCSIGSPYQSTIGYIAAKEYLNEYETTPLEFKYGNSDVIVPRYSSIYINMSLKDEYPQIPKDKCRGVNLCDITSEGIDPPYILSIIRDKVFNNHSWDTYTRIPDASRRSLNSAVPILDIDGDNYVRGRGWDGNDYAGESVRLYCKAGYYEDQKDHTCRQLPSYDSELLQMEEEVRAYNKTASDAKEQSSDLRETNTVYLAFMAVFCILFVAATVVLLLALFGVIPSPAARKSVGKSIVEEVRAVDI